MEQEVIDRTIRKVRQILGPGYDHEDIAMDIVIATWKAGYDAPSRRFIDHRCVNAYNKKRGESRTMVAQTHENLPDPPQEAEERINHLTKALSNEEKKIIWYRFYKELSIADIASQMRLSRSAIREKLEEALMKMRILGLEDEQ